MSGALSKKEIMFKLRREEALGYVIRDLLDDMPWLSIVEDKPHNPNNGVGWEERTFFLCVRSPDYILDDNKTFTINLFTSIRENNEIWVHVGFDRESYKVYGGPFNRECCIDDGWDRLNIHMKQKMKQNGTGT